MKNKENFHLFLTFVSQHTMSVELVFTLHLIERGRKNLTQKYSNTNTPVGNTFIVNIKNFSDSARFTSFNEI